MLSHLCSIASNFNAPRWTFIVMLILITIHIIMWNLESVVLSPWYSYIIFFQFHNRYFIFNFVYCVFKHILLLDKEFRPSIRAVYALFQYLIYFIYVWMYTCMCVFVCVTMTMCKWECSTPVYQKTTGVIDRQSNYINNYPILIKHDIYLHIIYAQNN